MRCFFFYTALTLFVAQLFAQPRSDGSIESLNSVFDEQAPRISPDGQTMYITRANHPGNIKGKKDPGDIWIASRIDSGWSEPVHAGHVINNGNYNAVIGFSSDGSEILLIGHYGTSIRTQGIAVSQRLSTGWAEPQNISIPYFMNKSTATHAFISADGKALVYSAEGYGTWGAEDIYVSLRNGNGWTEPYNLGKVINTRFQELSPAFSYDGKTLFFSSNGHKGFGSFDVFECSRLDDSWLKWSAPVNLGKSVNAEGRELFYHRYPKEGWALYTSTTNSDGYGDLRMHTLPPQPADSMNNNVSFVDVIRPHNNADNTELDEDGTLWIGGKVLNALTGAPIPAVVNFKGDSVFAAVAGTDGAYRVRIPRVGALRIEVEASNFISVMERLAAQAADVKHLEMNFRLQPIAVGATVNLRSVLFQRSTADLMPESQDELNLVADFMLKHPSVEIELAGHTDNRGLHSHNMRLSNQRVASVKKYLVDKGVSSKRISGKGYGGTRPIADNDAEETRQLNRRVEFTIVRN